MPSCCPTVSSGRTDSTRTGSVRRTSSRTSRVSLKCSPVSRNTTSTPGATRETRWVSTASAIELVTQNRGPKVSTAQRTISSADASSSSTEARAARSAISLRGYCRVALIAVPPRGRRTARRTSPRTPGRRPGTPRRRAAPRAVAGPRRRSTGRTAVWSVRSSQLLLIRSGDPLGERLAGLAAGEVAAGQPLDVVGTFRRGGLEPPQLAAEAAGLSLGHGQATAEVHLVALDRLPVRAGHELPLQADVGDLGPRAGVRAAVDVDGDVQVLDVVGVEPALQLGDERRRPDLGLHDGELAELDAGAGHGAAPPRRRLGLQPDLAQRGHQRPDLLLRHVQDQDLLVRSGTHPAAAV